jgi:probable phosphoglycerate mutase
MDRSRSPAPDCELWLLRHAQSEWNASGRWQGQADPCLSAAGREQLGALVRSFAEALGETRVDRLVCSDLMRTRQTARALGDDWGLEAQPDATLRELDVGSWSGLTRAEIAARDPRLLAAFEAGDPDVRPPGGETRSEIRVRAREAIRRIASDAPGERIVLVSHLGFIRALLPDQDLGNAEFLRVLATDALTRRERLAGAAGGAENGAGESQPL